MWTGRKPSIGHIKERRLINYLIRIRVSRNVLFDEERPWQWGKSKKFKGTLGATLMIEGFIPQDDREDDDIKSQTGPEFSTQALCSSLFTRSGVHGSYYNDLSRDLDQTFVKRDNGKRDKATGAVHRQQISSRS
nr:hypothetical protein [Tanacetum cinerariifolium]